MDLQGRIIAALDPKTGTSSRGEWVVQEFVMETHDAYPRKMVFSVFGQDRLQRFNVQVGQEVTVSFDIDAHEYNGRWFNSIRAFDVRQIDPSSVAGAGGTQAVPGSAFGQSQPVQAPQAAPASQAAPFPPADSASNADDDLPF